MTPRSHRPHGYDGEERRRAYRRDEDVADHEVAARVGNDASVAAKLIRAGKVASAAAAVGVIIGAVAGALGIRIVGPSDIQAQAAVRVNTNSARIDSLTRIVADLSRTVGELSRTSDNILTIECGRLSREKSDAREIICKNPAVQP
jgi:hypothetical protein